jgi:hypothetical protein
VKRHPDPDAPDRIRSTFRLTKGTASVLILYEPDRAGKIADFNIFPDRPYE